MTPYRPRARAVSASPLAYCGELKYLALRRCRLCMLEQASASPWCTANKLASCEAWVHGQDGSHSIRNVDTCKAGLRLLHPITRKKNQCFFTLLLDIGPKTSCTECIIESWPVSYVAAQYEQVFIVHTGFARSRMPHRRYPKSGNKACHLMLKIASFARGHQPPCAYHALDVLDQLLNSPSMEFDLAESIYQTNSAGVRTGRYPY